MARDHEMVEEKIFGRRPGSNPATERLKNFIGKVNAKLQPVEGEIDIAGESKQNEPVMIRGHETAVKGIHRHNQQKNGAEVYSLTLSETNQTVERSAEEIATHLLLESYLKTYYPSERKTDDVIDDEIAKAGEPAPEAGGDGTVRPKETEEEFGRQDGQDASPEPEQGTPVAPGDGTRTDGRDGTSGHFSEACRNNNPSGPPAGTKHDSRAEQEVLDFFKSDEPNDGALTIEEVLSYVLDDIEARNDFIQRLFPVDTKSDINPAAPVLTGREFLRLREVPEVLNGVKAGFTKILAFYSMENDGINAIYVKQGEKNKFMDRLQSDFQSNCKHLASMIRSLALLGMAGEASALFNCLKHETEGMAGMDNTLKHWRESLHDPISIPDDSPQWEAYLLPTKILPDDLSFKERDGKTKESLFEKQRECAGVMTDPAWKAPLIARFARPEITRQYSDETHLNKIFEGPPNNCAISSTESFYFQQPSDANPDVYEIHVDFANRCFGSAWKEPYGYAQEERAFLENVGLGAVAQQAEPIARISNAINPGDGLTLKESGFGKVLVTRTDGKHPSPVVVDGCVRVAKSTGQRMDAVPHQSSNWLAIAAPDYRVEQSLPEALRYKNKVEIPKNIWDAAVKETAAKRISPVAFFDNFSTAHAGFRMAKEVAGERTLKIQTGRLGCGVFNNSLALSAAAQVLAAKVIGVQNLKFHAYEAGDKQMLAEIEQVVDQCIATAANPNSHKTIRDLAMAVFNVVEARFLKS